MSTRLQAVINGSITFNGNGGRQVDFSKVDQRRNQEHHKNRRLALIVLMAIIMAKSTERDPT